MSRLGDLYKAMETLRKEGLSFSEDIESQVNALEENLIKKEILPVITETIEPALKQVQRELVLVVDYLPGLPISVHLSRKRNIKEVIGDTVEILPDPTVEHKVGKGFDQQIVRSPRKGLCIKFPNGMVIQRNKASETLVEFIRFVGYQKVRTIGIIVDRIPLVSNTKDKKYGDRQYEVASGWYVNTHSDSTRKAKLIKIISDALNLGVKVELVK